MAERMVETQAELPFIGDQVVCLSHDQAAPTIWLPKDRRVRSLSSGKVGAGVADPTSPIGFRRIGMFRAGSGTLDYWDGEPEAG